MSLKNKKILWNINSSCANPLNDVKHVYKLGMIVCMYMLTNMFNRIWENYIQ